MEIGVLVISDRVSAGEAQDKSGAAAVDFLKIKFKGNTPNIHLEVVPDEIDKIQEAVINWVNRKVSLIVTSGGTGFAPRDVTPEAISPLLQKQAPGLVHQMVAYSLQKTPHAMLSRPVAGVRDSSLIVTLPGSVKAVIENLEAIIPALPHALQLISEIPAASLPVSHSFPATSSNISASLSPAPSPAPSPSLSSSLFQKLTSSLSSNKTIPPTNDKEAQGPPIVFQPAQVHEHSHSHSHSHSSHSHSHSHSHSCAHTRPQTTEGTRRQSEYKMISVEEAMEVILNNTPIKATKKVAVDSASGYFLAEDVIATEPLPPFPASIKDGYAVIAEDGPGIYPVIGSVTAGAIPPFKVTKGTIARITTGSAVPEGADAVVMVEDTILLPKDANGVEQVKIEVSVGKGGDIRPIGCDVPLGQTILKAGDRLGPPEIGLLATLGIQEVSVYELPKVAILSTGDELAPHTSAPNTLEKGMIRDSNRPMLFSAIRSVDPNWADSIVDLGISKDTMEDLEKRVTKGIEEADVVITSGGVSMGELDLLKPLLDRIGKIHFGRVEMKPGKPLTFATVNNKIIFSLPGNPVSSLVTFHLFVLPALRKLSGQPASAFNPPSPLSPTIPSYNLHPYTTTIQARIVGEIKMDSERRDYQRVVLSWNDSARSFDAVTTGVQASCRLLSMKSANGLAIIQKGVGTIPPGSIVQVLLTGPIL